LDERHIRKAFKILGLSDEEINKILELSKLMRQTRRRPRRTRRKRSTSRIKISMKDIWGEVQVFPGARMPTPDFSGYDPYYVNLAKRAWEKITKVLDNPAVLERVRLVLEEVAKCTSSSEFFSIMDKLSSGDMVDIMIWDLLSETDEELRRTM